MPRTAVAVVGAGTCDDATARDAYAIGRLLAQRGLAVVTGGLGGVMEAASRGARDAGGTTIGILPGSDPEAANEAVEIAVPTGMGELRNGLVVHTGAAVIAVGGEWGTLSEIALALKAGKRVVGLRTWNIPVPVGVKHGIVYASTADEAVDLALETSAT